jgi:hypothetical protein
MVWGINPGGLCEGYTGLVRMLRPEELTAAKKEHQLYAKLVLEKPIKSTEVSPGKPEDSYLLRLKAF